MSENQGHCGPYFQGVGEAEATYVAGTNETNDLKQDSVVSSTPDEGTQATLTDKPSAQIASTGARETSASENVATTAMTPEQRDAKQNPGSEVAPQTARDSVASLTSNRKQRRHVCGKCGQSFFFLLHLKEHMKDH